MHATPAAASPHPSMEGIEQRSYLSLIHHSDNGTTHAGPGMAAVMRLTLDGTTPLYLLPIAEATAVVAVEQCHDALEERLVECYEY